MECPLATRSTRAVMCVLEPRAGRAVYAWGLHQASVVASAEKECVSSVKTRLRGEGARRFTRGDED